MRAKRQHHRPRHLRRRATRVLTTEYDLPRKTISPHDVMTNSEGVAWYSNFAGNTLGRLDPRTGVHNEYTFPTIKPGAATGTLALDQDRDGNWCVHRQADAAGLMF